MRVLGLFSAREPLPRGSEVIARTVRGLEHGTVLGPATPAATTQLRDAERGEVIRLLTAEDRQRLDQLRLRMRQEYAIAQRLVAEHRLQMQLVDIEHLFGDERIVLYFLAEKRIDFRELVRSLARELQCRIELRQIGVRDEAKLLADYGDCGKPVCCNTHMTVMLPVTMRMAKLQKATLDPAKISGRCGRLKCCLRFEHEVYEELQAKLPAVGSRILTSKGQGRVLDHEILAQRLLVEFEDGRRLPIHLNEVLTGLGAHSDSAMEGTP
jgi:cell fate regulator YaaT (PSP1 superfamily)